MRAIDPSDFENGYILEDLEDTLEEHPGLVDRLSKDTGLSTNYIITHIELE